jgi:hypothetical protein
MGSGRLFFGWTLGAYLRRELLHFPGTASRASERGRASGEPNVPQSSLQGMLNEWAYSLFGAI